MFPIRTKLTLWNDNDPSAAKQYIREQGAPIVIKSDGLAAGKGVTVAMTLEEAYQAVDSMLVKGDFGSAGCRFNVEEFLEEEVSFFALVDGENAIPLESAQDHKRVGDGDTGPNTGGIACRGELSGVSLNWSPESAMVVVMASKGYPGSYEKGTLIKNLEEAELVAPDIKIFHAGTAFDFEGRFIATGGRVLGLLPWELILKRHAIAFIELLRRLTGRKASVVGIAGEPFLRNNILPRDKLL